MSPFTDRFPSITNMIRLDHAHVMSTFRQYRADTDPLVKRGLVGTVCVALEIHAQLEEEIFYPAMRALETSAVLAKSVPEHDTMRTLIANLRDLAPTDDGYDAAFMALMRDVLHHVADEEAVLLPDAERLLGDRLGALGAAMTRRRVELVVPRSGRIVADLVRSTPAATMLMFAGTALSGAFPATPHPRRPTR